MIRITYTWNLPTPTTERYQVPIATKLYMKEAYEDTGLLKRFINESEDGLTVTHIFDWATEEALNDWENNQLHLNIVTESLEFNNLHSITETISREII